MPLVCAWDKRRARVFAIILQSDISYNIMLDINNINHTRPNKTIFGSTVVYNFHIQHFLGWSAVAQSRFVAHFGSAQLDSVSLVLESVCVWYCRIKIDILIYIFFITFFYSWIGKRIWNWKNVIREQIFQFFVSFFFFLFLSLFPLSM